jgi:CHAD domain-containing protein
MTKTQARDNSEKQRLRDAMRPLIAKRLEALWDREEAARTFSDPEGVHEMRVASRRLRSALDTSRDIFTQRWFAQLRKTVKTMARALGDVRDADMLLASLEEMRTSAAQRERPGIARLISRVTRERDDARVRLIDLLDDLDRQGFRAQCLRRFNRSDKAPAIRRRDGRRMIDGPVSEFLARAHVLPGEHDVEGLHDLRIAAKRLRYMLQLHKKAFRSAGSSLIDQLTELQDHLGEIHNLDVLIDLVRNEMHTLTDEAIDRAMTATPSSRSIDEAQAGLLALVATTRQLRKKRYDAFTKLWSTLQTQGFTEAVRALPRPQERRRHA